MAGTWQYRESLTKGICIFSGAKMAEHNHAQELSGLDNRRRLLIALSLTGFITIVEIVGGLLSHSLSLLGDAVHMFTDTFALGVSVVALQVARRPATSERTYGNLRAEILAALINGIILILVCAWIFYEAYQRFNNPPEIKGGLMLGIAAVGLVANLIGIKVLHAGSRHNLNVKGAFLHMLGDTLSSFGVIVAAAIVLTTDWTYADPIISILIGLLILKSAWGLVADSGRVLLEASPRELDVTEVIEAVSNTTGVRDIHDVHLWTLTSGVHALSAHLLIEDQMVSDYAPILERVNHLLKEDFGIAHITMQPECDNCALNPVCGIENHQS